MLAYYTSVANSIGGVCRLPRGGSVCLHSLLLLILVSAVTVGSLFNALYFYYPSFNKLNPPSLGKNPFFELGDVEEHNNQVEAKLKQCAEWGLLRNTSEPLPRLSEQEEGELIARGCGTNETTVVILSSAWFTITYTGAVMTGEVVYAQSVISTLNANHYSYLFSSLGYDNHDMRKTVEWWHKYRDNVRMVMADPEQIDVCWNMDWQKCLKTTGNENGIPAWKILGFWYWDDPGNVLGADFTLSPSPHNPNHLLSYSIEPVCRQLSSLLPSDRAHPSQAYLLAKQMHYLDNSSLFSWTLIALKGLEETFGIKVVGGIREDDEETKKEFEKLGLKNLGELDQMEFYRQIARSFVLVGVGRPRISPSPWDALCVGVPFINPILTWDEHDPDNRTKWHAQQWRMTDLEPPYVYHVPAHNIAAFYAAVKAARENPIESYIPKYMQWDFVMRRMGEVLEDDWRGRAEKLLEEWLKNGGRTFLL
ncbi:uncharacterized protein L203_102627 [Cryptococcus depauperatus CBS 7841]|uniref:Uncharacterized protein n=1 Tax=Cryptococcus depauperatus CBS 7841 TaxID=1295531 RepID=A0A1E3IDP8_9TREE|nr:hypothetical protein L203_03993 [Cryptococcus depauperatus CBS 7841]